MSSMLTNPQAILDAVDTATKELGFCPNRVWSVAKSLPGGPDQFPKLLPPTENLSYENLQVEDHRLCTFDFCEQSRMNFTLMTQRHENACSEGRCETIEFPSDKVEMAVRKELPTAWKFPTMTTLEGKEHYMAISHVWSDGTGAGNQPRGHVNSCLFKFFQELASKFDCVGIWWDTICIPLKKDLREKALKIMHRNYSAAAVTLVHDCFLRGCEWRDAESAAFYIVMSPWFSRGWTALELKESTRVKVLFKDKDSGGLITKDLDDDILQAGSTESAPKEHTVAREIIGRLRGKRFSQLNDLVAVLGSRYTSVPRDMAIISGLMIGVQMPETYSHQEIYQDILQEVGEVSHAHLFHDSATMTNGYNWCPTNLYDLPVTSRRETLKIEKNGNLFGRWDVMPLDLIKDDRFISGNAHPLVAAKVQLARQKKDRYVLLIEPDMRTEKAHLSRALLVEPSIEKNGDAIDCYCDHIGPVYFNPPLNISDAEHVDQIFSFNNIHIGHDMENHMDSDISTREGKTAQWAIEQMKTGSVDTQTRKREVSSRGLDLQRERKSKDWDEFMKSVIDGDYEKAEALLGVVENLNRVDRDGWSILHHAIWNGRTRVAKLLIARLDLRELEKSQSSEEPLHLAVERGNQELVSLLLEYSTVNLSRKDGMNALHLASSRGFPDIVDILLKEGWEINATESQRKQTALHMASSQGHQSVVDILISGNSQLDLKDESGETALSLAVRNGHETTALLLKEAGADIHLRDEDGRTLLHLEAASPVNRSARSINILCRIGVDLEARDNHSRTALHVAALSNQAPAISSLLDGERKANIEAKDSRERTPLHLAASENGFDAAERLMELGADIEARKKSNETPLHIAASNGHTEVIEALLSGDRRANIEARNDQGWTPLHVAGSKGHVDAAKKLMDFGADVEAREQNQWTPLSLAAQNNSVGVIEALLDGDRGANIEARDDAEWTPLHAAAAHGKVDAIKRLMELGADIEAENSINQTPLHLAARQGWSDAIEALLNGDRKANIEARDHSKMTPLHMAAFQGEIKAIRTLVAQGANIQARDGSSHKTPYQWALKYRQLPASVVLRDLERECQ